MRWTRFLLVPLVLFVGLRVFVLDAYSIPTSSMEGTLLAGDFLLVNKVTYGARIPGTEWALPAVRNPMRGEIVVFQPPHDDQRHYVKRVVGIPGDTLEMREKVLLLNGGELQEGYVQHLGGQRDAVHPNMRWQRRYLAAAHPSRRRYVPSRDNWGPIVVPPGQFFVLGDNRDNSEDSRYWGFVGRESIRGKPWLVYLSLREGAEGLLERVRWDRIAETVR